MPVYTIASVAGFDGSVVVEKLLEQDDPNLGFNPATGKFFKEQRTLVIFNVVVLILNLEKYKIFVCTRCICKYD